MKKFTFGANEIVKSFEVIRENCGVDIFNTVESITGACRLNLLRTDSHVEIKDRWLHMFLLINKTGNENMYTLLSKNLMHQWFVNEDSFKNFINNTFMRFSVREEEKSVKIRITKFKPDMSWFRDITNEDRVPKWMFQYKSAFSSYEDKFVWNWFNGHNEKPVPYVWEISGKRVPMDKRYHMSLEMDRIVRSKERKCYKGKRDLENFIPKDKVIDEFEIIYSFKNGDFKSSISQLRFWLIKNQLKVKRLERYKKFSRNTEKILEANPKLLDHIPSYREFYSGKFSDAWDLYWGRNHKLEQENEFYPFMKEYNIFVYNDCSQPTNGGSGAYVGGYSGDSFNRHSSGYPD